VSQERGSRSTLYTCQRLIKSRSSTRTSGSISALLPSFCDDDPTAFAASSATAGPAPTFVSLPPPRSLQRTHLAAKTLPTAADPSLALIQRIEARPVALPLCSGPSTRSVISTTSDTVAKDMGLSPDITASERCLLKPRPGVSGWPWPIILTLLESLCGSVGGDIAATPFHRDFR
jgi:hypothetical protein